MSETTLLYDADCGFCRWSIDRIKRWDRRDALRVLPIQSAEAQTLLGDMDAEEKMASWHLVGEDGVVRSAGAGFAPLFRLLPGGKPLAAMASLFPKSTDRGYRLIARNRERFGRMLGEQTCAVDPAARSHDQS